MTDLEKQAELALIEDLLKAVEPLNSGINRLCEAAKQSTVSMERFSSVAHRLHQAAQYLQTVERGLIVDVNV